jgi:hypothetical protein
VVEVRNEGEGMSTPPGSSPDAQRRYLLDAARSVEAHAEGDDSELAAKALHLASCVAAVDFMCRQGDLPGAWRAAELLPWQKWALEHASERIEVPGRQDLTEALEQWRKTGGGHAD